MKAGQTDTTFSYAVHRIRQESGLYKSVEFTVFVCLSGLLLLGGHYISGLTSPGFFEKKYFIINSPGEFFLCALFTVARLISAVILSFCVAVCYGFAATKTRFGERFLPPLLGVTRFIPSLSILLLTMLLVGAYAPGVTFLLEGAVLFSAVFSMAQKSAENICYALKNIPSELSEVTRCFKLNAWQKLLILDWPKVIPGFLHDLRNALAGGFIVILYAEIISVNHNESSLPGLGSYAASAVFQGNLLPALCVLVAIILLMAGSEYILLRPLNGWVARYYADDYRADTHEDGTEFISFEESYLPVNKRKLNFNSFYERCLRLFSEYFYRCFSKKNIFLKKMQLSTLFFISFVTLPIVICFTLFTVSLHLYQFTQYLDVLCRCVMTLLRIGCVLFFASLLWLPFGIWLALHVKRREFILKTVSYLSFFPVVILCCFVPALYWSGSFRPESWCFFLLIAGAQWSILLHVVHRMMAFPDSFSDVIQTFHTRGFFLIRTIIMPYIIPGFLSGLAEAAARSWCVVVAAEWLPGHTSEFFVYGVGSYLAEAFQARSVSCLMLGIVMMVFCAMVVNFLLWRPLISYVYRTLKIN